MAKNKDRETQRITNEDVGEMPKWIVEESEPEKKSEPDPEPAVAVHFESTHGTEVPVTLGETRQSESAQPDPEPAAEPEPVKEAPPRVEVRPKGPVCPSCESQSVGMAGGMRHCNQCGYSF